MTRAAAISHAAAARLGWTRIDPRPWDKTGARWEHRDGWQLAHSGHPTDIRPWSLWDPSGAQHTTGALTGDPTTGANWHRLDAAMAYVAGVVSAEAIERSDQRPPRPRRTATHVIGGERYDVVVGQLELFAGGAA